MKGKLILQDGTIFHGQLFGGSNVTAEGEVVFNTGMTILFSMRVRLTLTINLFLLLQLIFASGRQETRNVDFL